MIEDAEITDDPDKQHPYDSTIFYIQKSVSEIVLYT